MKFISRLSCAIVVGVCILMAVPIGTAINLAQRQAVQREDELVLSSARLALARSDETGDQIRDAARIVNGLTGALACSDHGLDVMRKLDLGSTLLQGVGWMDGDRMRCSSFSGNRPFDLGPTEFVSTKGMVFRTGVTLIDPAVPYVAIQAGSAVGIVHKDLALSFVEAVPGLNVAVFSWSHRNPIISRGIIAAPLLKGELNDEGVFRTDGQIVGVVRSKRYDTGAVAVLPAGHAADYAAQAARILVPIGLLVGLALSALLNYVLRSRWSMRSLIRTALRRREFYLVYQPVVELATGRMIGVEALIRWRRANGEVLTPEMFIPEAEQAGLVTCITARVLDLLGEDAKHILRMAPDFHFAVNFSAADMHRTDILEEVKALVDRSGIARTSLIVEATEQSVVNVDRARETMRALRTAGVRVAIDDFGTGYSSLAYLAQLEIDFLKIDRLFVHSLGTCAATSQVAARIIEMAKDLDLRIIAEGVETRQQELLLRSLGVEYAQGYLYDRPLAIDELLPRLGAQASSPCLERRTAA
jgi:sensor c-di-GMP phosphodiesterase-like protein